MASTYLNSKAGFPFSISLPLSIQTYGDSIVDPFFSNLLPDDLARHRVARLRGGSEKNPYASWQKGGVENINGRLRRDRARKTNIHQLSQKDVDENILNYTTTQKILGLAYSPRGVY